MHHNSVETDHSEPPSIGTFNNTTPLTIALSKMMCVCLSVLCAHIELGIHQSQLDSFGAVRHLIRKKIIFNYSNHCFLSYMNCGSSMLHIGSNLRHRKSLIYRYEAPSFCLSKFSSSVDSTTRTNVSEQ